MQLPERLHIATPTDPEAASCATRRSSFNIDVECNLLVVLASNFLLCIDKKLQLFSFQGGA